VTHDEPDSGHLCYNVLCKYYKYIKHALPAGNNA
jgi:hypothetical protein